MKRLSAADIEAYTAAIKRAKHEMRALGRATKWARKQQRKLLEEGDV